MEFVAYIPGEIGLTKASVKSCEVQAMNNDPAGQEIWRLTFKDYTSKKSINEFFRTPKNWNMEFWGTNQQVWKGFRVWGRWTEGTVGKIVRDSIDTIFRALQDAMGKDAVWASDGCSIDYRMSGIYEKADRTPRVVAIYSEEDADPKIYIYTYPPDGLTRDDWIRCMEHHFDEYHDKKLGGTKPTNTSTTVPKTPHYLEDRTTAFGRSYRSMKDLDGDYPDFLKQLTDHAVKTIDAQKGKKGKGKNKGKGGWDADKADKGDEKQKEAEQEKEADQKKGDGQQKGKGKAKIYPSPDARAEQANAQAGDRDKNKEKGPNTNTPTQPRTLAKGTLARARGHGEHGGPEAEEELSDPTGSQEELVDGDKQRPTPVVV